jgi:glycosyltransferase involved in cell wall biosynthesis
MFPFRRKAAPRDAPARPPLPTISVVTPSYNQARFLGQCIQSVVAQEYPKLEYIVVDGGSTDGSAAIIEQYERHLARWVSEPDRGQSDAINKGLRWATGDLVTWLNSDDFYLPGALAAVAEAYRSAPAAPFYFGDGWRVNEAGDPRAPFFPGGHVGFDRSAMIYGLNTVLQPAAFISRRRLVEVGYLDESLRYGMDTDLWIKLSAHGDPVPVPGRLAASREYRDTKTATGGFERIEELRRIAERHSGAPMTPGVLLYFLHTLRQLSLERDDVFPSAFVGAIDEFHLAAARLLARYGAGCDGFPLPGRPPSAKAPAPVPR